MAEKIPQKNLQHKLEVEHRLVEQIELSFKEWIEGVGRGFDWLHTPNMAIIMGPWRPNLGAPIRTAAGIIKANMDAGRIPSQSYVLLTSAIYRNPDDEEQRLAREKALFLKEFAIEEIRSAYPDLAALLNPLPVIVDMNTRKMTVVE